MSEVNGETARAVYSKQECLVTLFCFCFFCSCSNKRNKCTTQQQPQQQQQEVLYACRGGVVKSEVRYKA